jgi:hypothetical protein
MAGSCGVNSEGVARVGTKISKNAGTAPARDHEGISRDYFVCAHGRQAFHHSGGRSRDGMPVGLASPQPERVSIRVGKLSHMFQVHHVVRLLDKSVAEHTDTRKHALPIDWASSHVTETNFFIRFMARVLRRKPLHQLLPWLHHQSPDGTTSFDAFRNLGVSYIEPRRRQSRHTAFMIIFTTLIIRR